MSTWKYFLKKIDANLARFCSHSYTFASLSSASSYESDTALITVYAQMSRARSEQAAMLMFTASIMLSYCFACFNIEANRMRALPEANFATWRVLYFTLSAEKRRSHFNTWSWVAISDCNSDRFCK